MATKREITQELNIKPEYAWCRGLTGHRWIPPSVLYAAPKGTIILELVCQNCKAHRRDYVGDSGLINERRYQYSDGYLQKGLGRPKAGVIRHAALSSLLASKRVQVKPWKVEKG